MDGKRPRSEIAGFYNTANFLGLTPHGLLARDFPTSRERGATYSVQLLSFLIASRGFQHRRLWFRLYGCVGRGGVYEEKIKGF